MLFDLPPSCLLHITHSHSVLQAGWVSAESPPYSPLPHAISPARAVSFTTIIWWLLFLGSSWGIISSGKHLGHTVWVRCLLSSRVALATWNCTLLLACTSHCAVSHHSWYSSCLTHFMHRLGAQRCSTDDSLCLWRCYYERGVVRTARHQPLICNSVFKASLIFLLW